MKLAIIGGGGIRTPMLVEALLERQMLQLGQNIIGRITLMDVQADRLAVTLTMSKFLRNRLGSEDVILEASTDLRSALDQADFIITTMRVGFEAGRVIDEKIPLSHGCIGQETVGAGGFAMAIRTIPEMMKVAQMAQEMCPKAWIINFTNPAGIIAQAIHDAGHKRIVGICDSADSLHHRVANTIDVPIDDIETQVFGLNHCSLTVRMTQNGKDITSRLLSSSTIHNKLFGLFNHKDILGLGGLPNEYLYYYLYPRKAFKEISEKEKTRGEHIEELNNRFFTSAHRSKYRKDPGAVLALHRRIIHSRHNSYMDYAWEDTEQGERPQFDEEVEGEGYAGVALDFIEAVTSTKPVNMVLNIPPGQLIAGLSAHEVIEVTCRVNRRKIEPILPKEVPQKLTKLIRNLKVYETLTCQASRQKSKKLAHRALEANPLVQSGSKAKKIFAGFVEHHGGVFKEFK